MNRRSWAAIAERLDIVVNYFGPSTMPDDIIRSQVLAFKEKLADKYSARTIDGIISAGSTFYTWMSYKGFATTNPFKMLRHAEYKDVQVIA